MERQNLKNKLSEIIKLHYSKKIKNNLKQVLADDVNNNVENKAFQNNLTPWEKVQISRENKRPTGLDYIEKLVENFTELHGDRYFGDDSAIVGGIGTVNNKPVTVIAQVKGHNTKENISTRLWHAIARRLQKGFAFNEKEAEKFHRPIICFVDTQEHFAVWRQKKESGETIANL
ncbi:MAG: hypothetical protein ACLRR3_09470 [Eubacterium sp.]